MVNRQVLEELPLVEMVEVDRVVRRQGLWVIDSCHRRGRLEIRSLMIPVGSRRGTTVHEHRTFDW